MGKGFDEYAPAYDAWFLENRNVLYSEINLVAHVLKNPGRTLSVGCGSGLFETILAKEYGITITDGIEPSEGMAEIARKRGMKVTISTAEEADFGCGDYDTILFNGTPSYITDLESVVRKAYDALPEGGRIILIDVPKESTYGVLYNLPKPSARGIIRCSQGPIPRIPIRSNSSGSPTGARRPRRSSCSKKPDSGISASPRPSPRTRSTRTGRKSSRRKGTKREIT